MTNENEAKERTDGLTNDILNAEDVQRALDQARMTPPFADVFGRTAAALSAVVAKRILERDERTRKRPATDDFDPEGTAERLDRTLRGQPWYVATGSGKSQEGDSILFVYVNENPHGVPARFEGIAVAVKLIGESAALARP